MAHTIEFKINALNHAKSIGSIPQAAKLFGVDSRTLYRWNNLYHICQIQQMREFTDEEKKKILEYANQHGLTSAMREHNIDIATILSWNRKFKIYINTGSRHTGATHTKTYTRNTTEYKLEVLNFAKQYGVSKAIRKYNIPSATIQYWNADLKVYPVRKARTFTPEQKENIIQYANNTSITEAAKKFHLYGHQIQRWIDDKTRSKQ